MKNYLRKNEAITLVALVVTIIVLLILAGITINMLFGENGIIKQAQDAKEATRLGTIKERLILIANENKISGYSKEILEEELNKLVEEGNLTQEEKEELLKGNAVTINGEEIKIENYITAMAAGSKIGELKNTLEEVIGNIVSDGKGGEVPVPAGFYYVGGAINTGVVISDNPADENKYAGQTDVGTELVGNQFVWVPVDGTNLTYAQDHTYDSVHQYQYTNHSDWEDQGGNATNVETYGGFYIGRYEAGWSEEIEDGSTYETYNAKDIDTKTPISKAGVASWNFISQTKAKTVSSNMYSSSSTVTSSLVDSYAWDTTVNWLKNSGIIEENSEGKIDSTSYGNYNNSSSSINVTNTLYAYHIYRTLKTGGTGTNDWDACAESYTKGDITLGAVSTTGSDETNYSYTKRLEIATGSTETTKTNNIYDLAGNMWEWTTEQGNHDTSTSTFAVRRGGGFGNNGGDSPVVFRYGYDTVGNRYVSVGFRVVLYIK